MCIYLKLYTKVGKNRCVKKCWLPNNSHFSIGCELISVLLLYSGNKADIVELIELGVDVHAKDEDGRVGSVQNRNENETKWYWFKCCSF